MSNAVGVLIHVDPAVTSKTESRDGGELKSFEKLRRGTTPKCSSPPSQTYTIPTVSTEFRERGDKRKGVGGEKMKRSRSCSGESHKTTNDSANKQMCLAAFFSQAVKKKEKKNQCVQVAK